VITFLWSLLLLETTQLQFPPSILCEISSSDQHQALSPGYTLTRTKELT
jgi:hypothetical protein